MKTLKLSRDQAEKVAEAFLFGELEFSSLRNTARREGVASRLLPSGAKLVVVFSYKIVDYFDFRLSGYAYDGSDIKAVLDKIK
jgi:hypothetical protein